ncbi:hypothetical protein [Mycobacterium sp. OTB74]|jgi:hypothetical protein|uniref:hypothetical protein n=1 Tax=Mycobacterium sp. OTB74 TaxID=1853452 RepID=UPI002473F28F|nr:hypothetical protein [Mycobacterium sp. OTB74]MDH6247758.1 hypothetical protein [Mycobacterium sp. OTB74]
MTVVWDMGTAIAALVAIAVAIGGYVRFVLIRANIGAQFDVEFTPLGPAAGGVAGDVNCMVTNLGANTLLVRRVSIRYRYSADGDAVESGHGLEPRLGRTTAGYQKAPWINLFDEKERGRSVVFGGGTQAYRKPLLLAPGVQIVSIWARCDYQVPINRFNQKLVKLVLRPRGDLDFTGGVKNHEVRRTFAAQQHWRPD